MLRLVQTDLVLYSDTNVMSVGDVYAMRYVRIACVVPVVYCCRTALVPVARRVGREALTAGVRRPPGDPFSW